MFYDCTGLISIILPNGVTSIGPAAFSYRCCLEYVVLPSSLISIASRAFSDWVSIKECYCHAIIPPSLDSHAWNSTAKDAKLYVPKGCVEAYEASDWGHYFTNIEEM